jgi:RHS repeat-associated protein
LQFEHGLNGDLKKVTNTETDEVTEYVYDELGQLNRVTLADKTVIEYYYDKVGRRIAKKVNGFFEEGFLYQSKLQPAAKVDSDGSIIAQYIYATKVNVPEAIIQDRQTYAVVTDQIGSVRLVINGQTGEIAQRIDYDEFGNILLDTNPGFQPFGFAGGLHDHHTGLVHFNYRDYNPEIGRWMSKDPILFAGGDANLYGYVLGDPINFIDPLGLWSWDRFTDSFYENRNIARTAVYGVPAKVFKGLGTATVGSSWIKTRGFATAGDVLKSFLGAKGLGGLSAAEAALGGRAAVVRSFAAGAAIKGVAAWLAFEGGIIVGSAATALGEEWARHIEEQEASVCP